MPVLGKSRCIHIIQLWIWMRKSSLLAHIIITLTKIAFQSLTTLRSQSLFKIVRGLISTLIFSILGKTRTGVMEYMFQVWKMWCPVIWQILAVWQNSEMEVRRGAWLSLITARGQILSILGFPRPFSKCMRNAFGPTELPMPKAGFFWHFYGSGCSWSLPVHWVLKLESLNFFPWPSSFFKNPEFLKI